jgi:hypothetical protein
MDWLLLVTASFCGVVLLWAGRTARARRAHNINLFMERRVLESFAGLDAALCVAPAPPTEMPPDRCRKFVVIEGGKARRSVTNAPERDTAWTFMARIGGAGVERHDGS